MKYVTECPHCGGRITRQPFRYTPRQLAVVEFIALFIQDFGIAPTLSEIGAGVGGISRVAVLDHLRALERKGAITRERYVSRHIVINDPEFA